jgi:hypothetical protein
MTAMLLAIFLVALLSSLKFSGWRITASCAGGGAFFFGLASTVFAKFTSTSVPYPGSKGVGWGLVSMAGGLLFVVAAEWEARRSPATALSASGGSDRPAPRPATAIAEGMPRCGPRRGAPAIP